MRKKAVCRVVVLSLFFILTAIPSDARNMNIVVQPFEYKGDPQYSWISAGMTDTVISDLNKIRDINVISDKDRRKVLEELKFAHSALVDEETVVKIGKMVGANIIFTGSLQVSGDRLRVNAKLINVVTGKVESSTKLDGTLDRIFDLQDKVVFSLMGETEKVKIADIEPVRLAAEDKKNIEDKYKPKAKAYEWYSKGLQVRDKDPKLALDYFDRAIKIDPNYTHPFREAGNIAGNTLSLFTESQDYFDKADRIFKSRGETSSPDYAVLLMKIGTVYGAKGQLDTALKYFQDSQALSNRLGLHDTVNYSGLIMNIGVLYQAKGQFDTALKYFQDSQALMDRRGFQNTDAYSILLTNIGVIYWRKGQLDTALKYFQDSQALSNRLGLQNTDGYSNLLISMGILYEAKGQFDTALKYFQDSQTLMDRRGLHDTVNYSNLLLNIGVVYWRKGQLDTALKYFQDSQAVMDKRGFQDTVNYSDLLMNIGIVYDTKGQLGSALKYYQDSQALKNRLGLQNTDGYGTVLYNLAVVYEKNGQRNTAGRYFREAYETYIKAGYSGSLKDDARRNAERLGH